MSKTVKGLLEHCKKASNWKYIYGAKGKVLTKAQIQSLKSMYGSLVWDSDLNKAGNTCSDCSGLISSYTGIIRSSAAYKATATATATIAQLKSNWKAYIGWGIWLNGHIGVVSDTEGYYYAMDGSGRNWVHYPISKNNWQYVIRLKDIDYEISNSMPPTVLITKATGADINVFYHAFAGKWYNEVMNCNDTSSEGYAGVHNKAISGLAVKSDKGVVKLRVHLKDDNRWLAWVTRYDINDDTYGYAGILGKEIDGIQMEINGMPGYNILYRVSLVGNPDYLPWVTNWNDTDNGYAGIYGKSIDKVQIKVVKK